MEVRAWTLRRFLETRVGAQRPNQEQHNDYGNDWHNAIANENRVITEPIDHSAREPLEKHAAQT